MLTNSSNGEPNLTTPTTKQHAMDLFEHMQHAVADCLDRAADQHKDNPLADRIVIAAFLILLSHTCRTLHRMSTEPDVMANILCEQLDKIKADLNTPDVMATLLRSLNTTKATLQ